MYYIFARLRKPCCVVITATPFIATLFCWATDLIVQTESRPSLRAGSVSPLSHVREQHRGKQSGRKESGEYALNFATHTCAPI